jgi:AcrR family transcriptional regulator
MAINTKPRPYRSTLRDAQAAQTRERILVSVKAFLETDDLEQLTLRRIAELADISAPTVYAHFPTMGDLGRAFFLWLKPQLGTDRALPPLSDFSDIPRALYPQYLRQGRLLRNLMKMPAWDRLRIEDWKLKQEAWVAPVKAALPNLAPRQAERAAVALAAFSTPTVWRWLVEIADCSQSEAEQIAGWATGTLAAALIRDAGGLADNRSLRKFSVKKGKIS